MNTMTVPQWRLDCDQDRTDLTEAQRDELHRRLDERSEPHPLSSQFYVQYRDVEGPAIPQIVTLAGRHDPVTVDMMDMRRDMLLMMASQRPVSDLDGRADTDLIPGHRGTSYPVSAVRAMLQPDDAWFAVGQIGRLPWIETGSDPMTLARRLLVQVDALCDASPNRPRRWWFESAPAVCADALAQACESGVQDAVFEPDDFVARLIVDGLVTRAQLDVEF